MTTTSTDTRPPGFWGKLPVTLRAIVAGLLIGMTAANVWPVLLLNFGAPIAAAAEGLFLIVYLWWASGRFFPRSTQAARANAFRAGRFSKAQWGWGIIAAVAFAVAVNAAITVLFRLTPFPTETFRHGYDFSFIPTFPLRLLACVVSAISAGVCEEVGFRGYLQRPIEQRHGPFIAILISSVMFAAIHLNKGFEAVPAMLGITLGAGVLLGLIAWASGSLIPGIIGHAIMDTALFAFWWTGTLGDFTTRPISETGVDVGFQMACGVLGGAVVIVLIAAGVLRRLRRTA
jgi:membrane protease YdiL (CAAX protease family)